MELEDYFRNGKIYVWKERFAIVKARKVLSGAFAVIQDKNEITVIMDQSKVSEKDAINIDKDWKIITFDMVLPFDLVGFFEKIDKVLTKENIGVCIISAYTTDHILVKERDLPKAIKALEGLGLVVEEK